MTQFISPMLASPMPKDGINYSEWAVEEKFDGHRLVVCVHDKGVIAWSRYGLTRSLPPHIRESALKLPIGIYDGELLVPGDRSYGVTELTKSDKLVYVMFDMMVVGTSNIMNFNYVERRHLLTVSASENLPSLQLAESRIAHSKAELTAMTAEVWTRGGEGLILKKLSSVYQSGKRSKEVIKIKAVQSAVLTIVGYRAAKMGPQSTVVLRDDQGNETTVKTLNNKELARVNKDPQAFIGRKLRIEFQERTPDGNYRHPRWDRFENE